MFDAPGTLTVVTVFVRYEWQDAPEMHSHSLIVDRGTAVSDIIGSWSRSDRAELLDWRVDEYAPIPF